MQLESINVYTFWELAWLPLAGLGPCLSSTHRYPRVWRNVDETPAHHQWKLTEPPLCAMPGAKTLRNCTWSPDLTGWGLTRAAPQWAEVPPIALPGCHTALLWSPGILSIILPFPPLCGKLPGGVFWGRCLAKSSPICVSNYTHHHHTTPEHRSHFHSKQSS